jgi:hypothetical protein
MITNLGELLKHAVTRLKKLSALSVVISENPAETRPGTFDYKSRQ